MAINSKTISIEVYSIECYARLKFGLSDVTRIRMYGYEIQVTLPEKRGNKNKHYLDTGQQGY